MKKIRQRHKNRIEYEYEVINRELKASNDYNLKQYLHEKRTLRQNMGMPKDESNDSIAEMIGQSQNFSNSDKKKTDFG